MRAFEEKKLNLEVGEVTFACLGLTIVVGFLCMRMLEVRDGRRLARDEQEQFKRRPQMRLF
jgi:hypothetical protein